MDCAAAALVSHRLSKQAQNKTDGILPYWFRCWVQSFESSIQSWLAVWVRSEEC